MLFFFFFLFDTVIPGVEGELTENPYYEPLSIKNLADPSNWCHYSPHILKQGRAVWWSPPKEEEEEIVDVSRFNFNRRCKIVFNDYSRATDRVRSLNGSVSIRKRSP